MAIINKLVSASPNQGRNRSALDNTLVKYGDLNQVISEADAGVTKNNEIARDAQTQASEANENAGLAIGLAEMAGNKVGGACTQYSSCLAAAAAGVAVGTFFSLVKTFTITSEGGESSICSIPVIVCMPEDCEGLCW